MAICTELMFLLFSSVIYRITCVNANNQFYHNFSSNADLTLKAKCWQNVNNCEIVGNFTNFLFPNTVNFNVHINCLLKPNSIDVLNAIQVKNQQNPQLDSRFENTEAVSLNGCGVNSKTVQESDANNMGIEYIPNPLSVRHLTLEMFKITTDLGQSVFQPFKNLKSLVLRNNDIRHLSGSSLNGLFNLTQITLVGNSMTSMDFDVLKVCSNSLQKLTIHDDKLTINQILPLNTTKTAEFSVNQFNWTVIANNQTQSLESLTIDSTTHIINLWRNTSAELSKLKTLNMRFDQLENFTSDRLVNLQQLNLSRNWFKEISFKANHMRNLKILDISWNALHTIDDLLLADFQRLEFLHLSHNQIEVIGKRAFQNNTQLRVINIASNQLKMLPADLTAFFLTPQLKFHIGENPWSCAWVINFISRDAEVFKRQFSYENFLGETNIKGLKCVIYKTEISYYHEPIYVCSNCQQSRNHEIVIQQEEVIMEEVPWVPTSSRDFLKSLFALKPVSPRESKIIAICIVLVGVIILLIGLYFFIKFSAITSTLDPSFYQIEKF